VRKTVAQDRAKTATLPKRRNGMSREHDNALRRARAKLRLITPQNLDGRSAACQQFNKIVRRVAADLGGSDALTEIEKHLITSFAGAAILQGHQVAKLLSGEEVDIDEYSAITTSMIRSATRLGTDRRAKAVSPPTVDEYLASRGERTG
jgi:hypothetical protein